MGILFSLALAISLINAVEAGCCANFAKYTGSEGFLCDPNNDVSMEECCPPDLTKYGMDGYPRSQADCEARFWHADNCNRIKHCQLGCCCNRKGGGLEAQHESFNATCFLDRNEVLEQGRVDKKGLKFIVRVDCCLLLQAVQKCPDPNYTV